MKIRAQLAMVLNLDKCIGCHTCSVTCKNVWTSKAGMEYAWYNNVESKPGIGYPDDWENQEKWKGGWKFSNDTLKLNMGNRNNVMRHIFANPFLPQIDDYYEPFTFNYSILHQGSRFKTPPSARPYSIISGEKMEKIEKGPNWEDALGGTFDKRSKEQNMKDLEKEMLGEFENSFLMYVPRLCEHCLNPACLAACPSAAIYKREEDGIVLIDQDKCRGWRMCISACPYKKIYFNWKTRKSEKCTLCYPRLEVGDPTLCSESCVGRIRYIGVMLYDADRIKSAASTQEPESIYQEHLNIFLDPNDEQVIQEAQKAGIPHSWLEAAKRSPVYKLAMDWKLAFPLHPEYRTLPMVWYVPPLSPIQSAIESGKMGNNGIIPDADMMRIPEKYLANMLTAGDEAPVHEALTRMLSMRAYMRAKSQNEPLPKDLLSNIGMTAVQIEEMYRYLAIANYSDRFVIPTSHREYAADAFGLRSGCGFADDEGCSGSNQTPKRKNLFGGM